jgi:hypothetical protein
MAAGTYLLSAAAMQITRPMTVLASRKKSIPNK